MGGNATLRQHGLWGPVVLLLACYVVLWGLHDDHPEWFQGPLGRARIWAELDVPTPPRQPDRAPREAGVLGGGDRVTVAGGRLSPDQLYALARGQGLASDRAVTSVAVALAESGGRARAVNRDNTDGTVDRCAWQINSVHAAYDPGRLLDDPAYCARAMAEVSHRGTDWSPWVAYDRGRHRRFLPTARAAARRYQG